MNEEARDGLTRQQFARYYLMKLGIGQDLTRIALDPKHPRRLASEAEVLALRPELTQIEQPTLFLCSTITLQCAMQVEIWKAAHRLKF